MENNSSKKETQDDIVCSLCRLKTKIHVYDESDPRWSIIDCMSCILPMVVWRGKPLHTMDISDKDAQEMENALVKVANKKFGEGKFYIDKVQNEIPDHIHWHARPYGWKPKEIKDQGKAKIVPKEWGHEIWLANNESENYCGKILYIDEGCSSSMHFHAQKHESFYTLEGILRIDIIDTQTGKIRMRTHVPGDTFTMERNRPHQLSGINGPVKFIEISTFHRDSDSFRVWK